MVTKSNRRILSVLLFVFGPLVVVKGFRAHLGPRAEVPPARVKGDANAKVLIVEYSDFQCPACARMQEFLRQLVKRYDGRVGVAFKHFPLKRHHPNALRAHQAAECAAVQGQFWPYHDTLFETQSEWASLADPTDHFRSYAAAVGLDLETFNQCLENPSRLIPIELDIREGRGLRVRGTPTFFVGEKRLVGRVFKAQAHRVIERELSR